MDSLSSICEFSNRLKGVAGVEPRALASPEPPGSHHRLSRYKNKTERPLASGSSSLLAIILLGYTALSPVLIAAEHSVQRARSFEFEYAASIIDLTPGKTARVWIPIPQADDNQDVKVLSSGFPTNTQAGRDEQFGNSMLYFEAQADGAGEISFSSKYRVRRKEVRAHDEIANKAVLSQRHRTHFLRPNALVPVDHRPLVLLQGQVLPNDPMKLARHLYDLVDDHVATDKSKPGYGNGDSAWVCDSRYGNCTDFHSLFISLARARGLPARFEIGFPLPPERGQGSVTGYHCWAYFYVEQQGWIPVDISEADKHPDQKEYYFGNLTENRLAFSVGRDVTLVPRQDGPPLNYFIYPYVEVDGRLWPKEKMKLEFSYAD